MKKGILLLAGLAFSIASMAQITSKHGENFLPEAEDHALGFSATPFLNYAGNMFNQFGNNAPTGNFTTNDFSITGKYFVSDKMAYRARARFGINSGKTYNGDDVVKTSSTNLTLGGGVEHRMGETRIQGFCGAEGLLTIAGNKTVWEYDSASTAGPRPLESKQGTSLGVGARAFAGVEVFVFPKTSIAFEYGYGLMFMSFGDFTNTMEDGSGGSTDTVTKGGSAFSLDTDNNGGMVTIMFHF